jgi:hypothetical protein
VIMKRVIYFSVVNRISSDSDAWRRDVLLGNECLTLFCESAVDYIGHYPSLIGSHEANK